MNFIVVIFCLACCNSDKKADSNNNNDKLTSKETDPGIDWVDIPAGSFTFGSPPGTPCRAASAEKEVPVTLTRPFKIAATPVTQAQWEALSLPNPSWTKGPNKPVTRVNFYEAALWSNKLSMLEGLDTCYNLDNCKNPVGTGCIIDENRTGEACSNPNTQPIFVCDGNIHKYQDRYSCPGYRLPTVAEWEYAAKANVTDTHTYGGDLHGEGLGFCSDQPSLNDIAWYCHNSDGVVQDVALKQPNPWGLFDTLGNVYEMVDNLLSYGSLSIFDDETEEYVIDPIGHLSGVEIEIRGCHFNKTGCQLRPTERVGNNITGRAFLLGFRPVRTIFVEGAEDDVEPDPEEVPEEDSEEDPEKDPEEVPNPGL